MRTRAASGTPAMPARRPTAVLRSTLEDERGRHERDGAVDDGGAHGGSGSPLVLAAWAASGAKAATRGTTDGRAGGGEEPRLHAAGGEAIAERDEALGDERRRHDAGEAEDAEGRAGEASVVGRRLEEGGERGEHREGDADPEGDAEDGEPLAARADDAAEAAARRAREDERERDEREQDGGADEEPVEEGGAGAGGAERGRHGGERGDAEAEHAGLAEAGGPGAAARRRRGRPPRRGEGPPRRRALPGGRAARRSRRDAVMRAGGARRRRGTWFGGDHGHAGGGPRGRLARACRAWPRGRAPWRTGPTIGVPGRTVSCGSGRAGGGGGRQPGSEALGVEAAAREAGKMAAHGCAGARAAPGTCPLAGSARVRHDGGAVSLPARKLATIADLLAVPEAQRFHEIIDGELRPDGDAFGRSTAGPRYRSPTGFRPYNRRPGGRWPGGWWFATEVEVQPSRSTRSTVPTWPAGGVSASPSCPRRRRSLVRPDWARRGC